MITKLRLNTKSLLIALLFTFSISVQAQTGKSKLSGKVINSQTQEAVSGAIVLVKNATVNAVTDANGSFTLETASSFPLTLVVSSMGYVTFEQEISGPSDDIRFKIQSSSININEVVITARRRKETVQEVPIAASVVGGAKIDEAGAFNVNRVKELVPSVQLYSSNPRNTTLNIRGLGSTFGLTNDGLDPGVGFYVDGVYYARPAVTTLDFIDIEQIEVLRGPQGTLFGKNTTSGAFNITTRAASLTPGASFEASFGNYGFIQTKVSVTGPVAKKLAARVSFSGTQRDGILYNTVKNEKVNTLNNLGIRAQLLFFANDKIKLSLIGDASQQNPNGYAQVVAGVAPTQRPAYRQFNSIIADLNYKLPSNDAFDRLIDQDTPWRSRNESGGVSFNADFQIGQGKLTSTTAWRYWNWGPSNDRDFTGLQVLALSQAPSKHQQLSQEIRYAGNLTKSITVVVGVFAISQNLKTDPYHTEESGRDQWRFSQSSTSANWKTPGLLDGYGIRTYSTLNTISAAAFANLDWAITKQIHVLPGVRYNYDEKKIDYRRETYGGLQTTNAALLAIKNGVYNSQAFNTSGKNQNVTGVITLQFKANEHINTFATVSTNYKPIGINLGGLPTINGETATDLAVINPEFVTHYEAGIKTTPTKNSTFNIVAHNSEIKDYQTLVQTAELGVNRGYLATAEKVRVFGVEVETSTRIGEHLSTFGSVTYTEGKYVSFVNAPLPLEETGAAVSFKDISGSSLPGISKWAGSFGLELQTKGKLLGKKGHFFIAGDGFTRSTFSSSPSPSKYLIVPGYALYNSRIGFRTQEGVSFTVWVRNIGDRNYYEQLLPAAGNAGHYAGVLGDPRTYGATLKYSF